MSLGLVGGSGVAALAGPGAVNAAKPMHMATGNPAIHGTAFRSAAWGLVWQRLGTAGRLDDMHVILKTSSAAVEPACGSPLPAQRMNPCRI
ncbi:hypothetical protein GGQ86_004640 [Xanthobacter flavus]|uniref:Uncharacterized protein n=2 Tax=Xanthobacter flavus TaxID=281 RepID=A0ABU1KNG4_XANFL|nr:hypothetical protein [Xanthobacter flavus]